MAFVSFMAHGIKLWAEYSHRFDDPELVGLTLDKDSTNIEPLVGSDIIELAYSAIDLDIAEVEEYKRECMAEMRYEQRMGEH
jgi:hypothetical protein